MSSIDQQFVEFVVKSLVGNPDAVKIDRRVDEKGVLLELTVDPEDLGRVIGKRGATAQSLRTLLRALGTKNEARYNLKIVDNGPPPASRGQARDDGARDDQATDDQPKQSKPKSDDGEVPARKAYEDMSDEEAEASAKKLDEAVAEAEKPEAPSEEADNSSDRLAQTRAELADLDDLDI